MLRPLAPLVSPRHRRWRRLLSSLDYDPGAEATLNEPGADSFIICGCPRTGTSLLTAQLFQPPALITVMEPWDGMRMPAAELFADLRREIEGGELRRGRLDVGALTASGEVRWCGDGEKPVPVQVEPGFVLGVKWPAFWRYLESFERTRFLVCVRDPVTTIASFKKAGGRLAQGLNYDVAFNFEMNNYLEKATSDLELRRVLLYEYINGRILQHVDQPNVLVVHYERWFDDADGLRSEISEFLAVDIPRWRVQLRRPTAANDGLTERELALIAEHCSSAQRLQYSSFER